jgi:para-nitrobenzyl esterase
MATRSAAQAPTVSLSMGEVRGSTADGIDRFLGLPYAAAPIGPHRFALPAPHPGWSGVRDATALGPTAPQAPYGGGIETLLPTVEIPGDEFLNLNVWAPAGASALPVMVWVHGGSLSHGANALSGYDGTTFARDGVVYVAINYRLGSEGFSVLDGAPLNLGLADVVAALRWVRSEIAAFGGDPNRVTVFGRCGHSSRIRRRQSCSPARSCRAGDRRQRAGEPRGASPGSRRSTSGFRRRKLVSQRSRPVHSWPPRES